MSHVAQHTIDSSRYAKCVELSKRIRWDPDRDVIRGRGFDFSKTFLPDGLSKVAQLPFPLEALVRLTDEELKHQELFRRLETMTGVGMPAGCRFLPQPNDVAQAVE